MSPPGTSSMRSVERYSRFHSMWGVCEVTGGPVPVVEGSRDVVQFRRSTLQRLRQRFIGLRPRPCFGVSCPTDLALSDRNGAAAPLKLPPGPYQFPRISPDGKRVAFETDDGKEANVWIYDLDGQVRCAD